MIKWDRWEQDLILLPALCHDYFPVAFFSTQNIGAFL